MSPSDLYQMVGPSVEGPMPLIVLTDGWLEASDTLAHVRDAIVQQADLVTVAEFDTDELLDQRARRPLLNVQDGVTQGITWPELELAVGSDVNERPFLLLHGPEPDFRWRPFGRAVADLAASIGVTTTHPLGAYPAPMPHTRPIRISSTASDASLLVGREHTTGQIVVPVGVFAAITAELEAFGVPTHGLFAQVPYYLSSMMWPQASIAMIETLTTVAGLTFDTSKLEAQVGDAVGAAEALFEDSPSLHDVVTRLESRHDELRKLEQGELPTGDEIEEELQQYLRKIDGE